MIVKKNYFDIKEELLLECGKLLRNIHVVYETYGELNPEKSNAILIFHALSGGAHAAGLSEDSKPGWWDSMIGDDKAFDTKNYFVICMNILGSCYGTTGPNLHIPGTNRRYGMDFPVVTLKDMIRVQKMVTDSMGIEKLLAISGGSMGGMQALLWSILYPDSVKLVIPMATAAWQSAQNIGFHEVGRRAILSDPNWNDGDYYGKEIPRLGLSIARMIGHITYLSESSLKKKFGRRLQEKQHLAFDFSLEFQIESYLHHQGNAFVDRFDANSYLYITKAIDYFDLTEGEKVKLEGAFGNAKARYLILSYSSDWLYPTHESKEIVKALQRNGIDVISFEIDSPFGHDSFLLENETQTELLKNVLNTIK